MAPFLTNLNLYLTITEEAVAEARQLDGASRTPRPDGQPGDVLTFDPESKSFKQSLIGIAFAGMYLEALLGLVGRSRLGKQSYKEIEHRTSEDKLRLLGIVEPSILAGCKRFREARNDLIHEKAIDLEASGTPVFRTAQQEAAFGLEFVKSIKSTFDP
jgi:hypothetical protein